jgi:hypothetical protein
MCEKVVVSGSLCPSGYIYDEQNQTCTLLTTTLADCSVNLNFITGLSEGSSLVTTSFLDKTTQEIKCIMQNSEAKAITNTSFEINSLPLQVGQQLYFGLSPITLTGIVYASDINGIQNATVIGGGGGISLPSTSVAVTLNLGVVQSITLFSNLSPC